MTNFDFYKNYDAAYAAWSKDKNGNSAFDKWLFLEHSDILLLELPHVNLTIVKKQEVQPNFRPYGINSPDWVTIICEKDGKYLCVEQLRYGIMQHMLEFPCGMIEVNETAFNAAIREFEEETGYYIFDLAKTTDNIKYLGKVAANPAFMNNYMHYFYINLDDIKSLYEVKNQQLDEHEQLSLKWIEKDIFIKTWLKQNGSTMIGSALYLLNNK